MLIFWKLLLPTSKTEIIVYTTKFYKIQITRLVCNIRLVTIVQRAPDGVLCIDRKWMILMNRVKIHRLQKQRKIWKTSACFHMNTNHQTCFSIDWTKATFDRFGWKIWKLRSLFFVAFMLELSVMRMTTRKIQRFSRLSSGVYVEAFIRVYSVFSRHSFNAE